MEPTDTDGLSERARRWASTMQGHPDADPDADVDARTAHADSRATVGVTAPLHREEREELERLTLAPGATPAHGAGDRPVAEAPDAERTCFQRDRDRILHAAPFRRLAGKTQVFVFPDDHQRTRLTHALEVSQVATSIARTLRLNVPLTEAIALGHDCGHGPGGHASEDALMPFVAEGFDHAVWGADVVLAPLNLCRETSDGIRNHSWSRPAPATPEGEVVSWADRIAYVCHDFEDAVSAGVVDPADLPAVVRDRCGTTRGSQLRAFIDAVVGTTLIGGHVAMDPAMAEALAAFRACNYERIYLRPESVDQADAVQRLLRGLVEHLAAVPEDLPAASARAAGWPPASSTEALRAAVTYVAGMTDRYAVDLAERWLGWDPAALRLTIG
jgi:dGTPase